jgi:beta-lactamase class D
VQEAPPDLEEYFQSFDGAFVLYRLSEDRYFRYNPERCSERLLPASTFKIINALIGLETGVVQDENSILPWDGTPYEIPEWNQDHSLKTAFQGSVVWYYQEIARRVGREKMQHYLEAVGYGNQEIGSQIDRFWLDGTLQISADEQVEFLKRLYRGDLPFSKRSMNIVREIMLVEEDEVHRLGGKTGSGVMGDQTIGWFVGYEERHGNVYFFALNITGSSPEANGMQARGILLSILPFFETGYE